MEHQTQDQIQLLFVMPSEDETATVRTALAQHPIISIIPCQTPEMLTDILSRQPVDAACLIADGAKSHSSDTDVWIAQLKALDKQLPIIVLASPATRAFTAGLMADKWINW